ncbi:alpha/beta fold hydrolase [Frigidibacter sp. MR17.24]|uniref:alpha/beta fold hydrolase n=1 Tax=Frigidibacter sp. MR17.24 TaxID=3127345 RepID=UPI003012BC1A
MTDFLTASDGVRIAYDDRGSGQPLLCLSGLTRNMGDFEFVLPLAGRCRLIRMDYRGRGRSDHAPHATYNLMREGQDALELLDHLGIARTAILGTSRGGLIAMGLAGVAKPRLSGVVLNDVGPVIDPGGLARIFDYVGRQPAAATLDDMAERTRAALEADFPGVPLARWRRMMDHWYRPAHPGTEGTGIRLNYDPKLLDAMKEQTVTGTITDLWPFFDALDGLPLGAIRGANSDLLSPATLAEMARRRPDMLVAEVPDRGHVPFLDEPAAVRLLETFLDRLQDQP